jgi:hypothetical protein
MIALCMTGTLSLRDLCATSRNELECVLPTFIICYFLDLCFAETTELLLT